MTTISKIEKLQEKYEAARTRLDSRLVHKTLELTDKRDTAILMAERMYKEKYTQLSAVLDIEIERLLAIEAVYRPAQDMEDYETADQDTTEQNTTTNGQNEQSMNTNTETEA